MSRIGIGVIGGGGIAAEGHISGYQLDPRCEVVALWDNDPARVREQAQRLGVSRSVRRSMNSWVARISRQYLSVPLIICTANMPMRPCAPANMCWSKSP